MADETVDPQEPLLDRSLKTLIDRRTKAAKAISVEYQCAHALKSIVAKFGLKLCQDVIHYWPTDGSEY